MTLPAGAHAARPDATGEDATRASGGTDCWTSREASATNDAQHVTLLALARRELQQHVTLVNLSDAVDAASDRLAIVATFPTMRPELGVDLVCELQHAALEVRAPSEWPKPGMRLQEQP